MRWPPIIFDVALTILVRAAVLLALRQRRARVAALIAYSSALKVDAPGLPLRIPPAAPETLHVDLVGP